MIQNKSIEKMFFIMLVFMVACEEDTEGTPISQFDGPQDVALICYDEDKNTPLPLNCCREEVNHTDGECDFGISDAKLYAFVTQTAPGEVAVVDVEEQVIIDQDSSIPYNSFIPVGGQPNDIVATDDGTRIYTANRETGDISIIKTVVKSKDKSKDYSVINHPYLSPANSIDLGGEAGKMVLVKQPAKYKDKVAIVTQPTLGRLTVVSLDAGTCPDPEKQIDGCVKGYLQLENPDSDELVRPSAITDAVGQSIFVGSFNASVIFDIQLESLVEEAMSLEEPTAVSPDNVINETIDIEPYKIRKLSIEPKKQRWLYGIESSRGEVIAMDLGSHISGSGDPMKTQVVNVPGIARSVRILELEEKGEDDPFTFNGTFAVVTTTRAAIAVIDIEDGDQESVYFRANRIRSIVDITADGGAPKIENEPTLSIDGERVEENRVDHYMTLVEDDAGVGCENDSEGFKSESDYGVRFRCDPYESRREKWSLVWQGPIGLSGVGVVTNIKDKGDDEPWMLLNEDMAKDFCASELYTKDAFEGYPGDRLYITSEPTPVEGADDLCEDTYKNLKEHPLVYRIVGVSKYNTEEDDKPNVIEFEKDGENSRNLLPKCYGQALNFEVRAAEHWTIRGSRSSYSRQKGGFIPETKTCNYDESPPSELRVYEGKTYKNNYITFKMEYGDAWKEGVAPLEESEDDTDNNVEATFEFEVVDGYEEMYRVIGATNITDIEVSPNNDLMLVDQGGEGLIVFDLIDDFTSVGRHIN